MVRSYVLSEYKQLLRAVAEQVPHDAELVEALNRSLDGTETGRAHLAVMHEPYLGLLLSRRKTVESRFSRRQVAPYGQVSARDVLLLKSLAGPVCGIGLVTHVQSYVLDPATWSLLRKRYAAALCARDDEFWDDRAFARYATLMSVSRAASIEPLPVDKRDRRGWVVLGTEPGDRGNRHQLAWRELVREAQPTTRSYRIAAAPPEEQDGGTQLSMEL